MASKPIIKDKQKFMKTAGQFLDKMFSQALKNRYGEIEIRTFTTGQPPGQYFCQTIKDASDIAFSLCNSGIDVYFGVNPRVGKKGKKENVHYVSAFHAEVDYGSDGHKKKSDYESYDDAITAVIKFKPQPTLINLSGGGLHCYWVLDNPIKVDEVGVAELESINKYFIKELGGDKGTHNLDRVLRIPGTYNFKLPNNPREVRVVDSNGPVYSFEDFKSFIKVDEPIPRAPSKHNKVEAVENMQSVSWEGDIAALSVSDRIKKLIEHGNDGTYPSRSEADQAVVTSLVHKGLSESEIKSIFQSYPEGIGQKYMEHKSPDKYLRHNITKAKEFSNLTEEERQDPIFISGALHKSDNDKVHLKIVPFQEYMNKKHMLKFLENEREFFRYNGKCYEQCSQDRLHCLCQSELRPRHDLFTLTAKANFIHFAIGSTLINSEKAFEDQERYLTMQNGLYDLSQYKLIPHSSEIFTTNLLPYDNNPNVECPRWLQYLDEVFLSDMETIMFVQEAVGYAFHKSIPKAVLFFLIGDGGNGKSVFIDVISSLCGKENVCNISLNRLNDEKYLPELFGKMINVSGETPNARCMNTDLIKSVVAGDWVTGREVYKKPAKFKPYAKHYLGMNTLPEINDNTHGMWRRIHVIEFPRKFSQSEMDVELTSKLMDELSGIFNWALEGYRRLRDQGFIFSESPTMRESKKQYKQKNSNVLDFAELDLRKKLESEESIPFKEIYENYKVFCVNEGVKRIFPKKDFRLALESEGYRIINSSKHANQLRIFGNEIGL